MEAFLENPPERYEWVDEKLVGIREMTAKTGRIQARLAYHWRSHMISSGQGGEIYTETACRTVGRVRCPDVAYLPPALVHEFGDFKVLPHSFSLIAEIVSPTDAAEDVFTKVREYLASNAQEVWLIFPESRWLMMITADSQRLLPESQNATTIKVLPGFSLPVGELIA
ncbi:Uma2 family endonuclease [Gloeomargarita lithophora]|nr:Uma2 family endonuclease [Gloeomargarita lithophora]